MCCNECAGPRSPAEPATRMFLPWLGGGGAVEPV